MKRKGLFSVVLAGVLLLLAVPFAAAAGIPGDVDGDGAVTAADARIVLRFAVYLEAPTTSQRKLSDLDEDGSVSAADARLTLRKAVGLEADFASVLYGVAHRYNNATTAELPAVDHFVENVYRRIGKWCCYYTVHDVFRPALRKAGYSEERISQLAPNSYDAEKVNTAMKNATSISLPFLLRQAILGSSNSVYIPSLLADYYITHPEFAETFRFYPYYDDILTLQQVLPTENRRTYTPQIGDILFASNKTSTYVDGQPTIDHTAQIIRVNEDGSFVCTDGCILFPDGAAPRVCEQEYVFNAARGAYEYKYNGVVVVLMIARPAL